MAVDQSLGVNMIIQASFSDVNTIITILMSVETTMMMILSQLISAAPVAVA